MKISSDIDENLAKIKSKLSDCYDLVTKEISLGKSDNNKIFILYFDTLIDKEWVFDNVIKPLTQTEEIMPSSAEDKKMKNWIFDTVMQPFRHREKPTPSFDSLKKIEDKVLEVGGISKVKTFNEIVEKMSNGDVVLLYHSIDTGLSINLPGWKLRNIEEPQGEKVVSGPKEGFIESLNINIGLLRRRFRTDDLKAETMSIGKTSKTNVALVYLETAVNKEVLNKVKKRLKNIKLNIIIDSSHIGQLIEDRSLSPFPQLVTTERPDKVSIGLSQGRVAIMMEGSPHALLVPGLFIDFLHSVEDYYHRFYYSLAVRFLRYLMYGVALLLPALYIAITTYHQEMIPTSLLITITSSRTGVPFPALIEALAMETVFEALREAGLRLPKAIGPAVTIVGALIIGEAAVTAGIVSQPMVIVVALTGIASFTIPNYNAAISERLLRFPIMLLAASLGLFGILISILILIIHLASIESFGIPYLSPLAPLSAEDLPDLFRVPLPYQNARREKYGAVDKDKKDSD